jgi:hypothetical protein
VLSFISLFGCRRGFIAHLVLFVLFVCLLLSLSSVKEAVELPMTHPEMYEDIGIKVREDVTAANFPLL